MNTRLSEKRALGIAQCGCLVAWSAYAFFECLDFLPFGLLLSNPFKGAGSLLRVCVRRGPQIKAVFELIT